MMRWLPFILCLVLLVIVAVPVLNEFLPKESLSTSPMVGKRFPMELSMPTLETLETTTNFSQFKGKVWLLEVFASWCSVCADQAPIIQALAEGTEVPLVGLAWHDTPQALNRWLAKHEARFETVMMDTGEAGIALGITGTPEWFVIDKQGIIRVHHRGELANKELLTMLHAQIQEAKDAPVP